MLSPELPNGWLLVPPVHQSHRFSDVDLCEEARIAEAWNQALTLLWPENGDVPEDRDARRSPEADEEEPLLKELDGILPWPGRSRRR